MERFSKLFRTGVGGRNREREKKCPLNFHCFESRQFNESYNLDPCFVYTFSFQNTKNTLFGRLVIFSLYINSAHSLHFSPERTASFRLARSTTPEEWSCLLGCVLTKLSGRLCPIFFLRYPTALLTTQESLKTNSLTVNFVNLTQPGKAWEKSQHEGLARSSWPVSMFVGDCLNCCGMIQPTVGSAIP